MKAYGLKIRGQDAYRKEGASPLTAYTYVNVARGRTVWFVWMNSANLQDLAILERVAGSLQFNRSAPMTLQEAYGEVLRETALRMGEQPLLLQGDGVLPLTLTGYRAPIYIYAPILCGDTNAPVCNGTHTGSKRYAIDIAVATGTSVKNARSSYYEWGGWNSAGFGWLVIMFDAANNYDGFYAHLSSINSAVLQQYKDHGLIVPQGFELGLSGSSGYSEGPHLHFHLQTPGGTAISLSGMANLTLNSSYPNCSCATCDCIKQLPGDQCTCGRVN